MSLLHVLKIGVTAAILSLIASVIAAIVAVNRLDIETGLWVRVGLVALSLLLTAVFWSWRSPKRPAPELSLFIGLVLGWVLNLQSWIGRSYAGQLQYETGVPSAAADLVYWVITSAIIVGLISLAKHRSKT